MKTLSFMMLLFLLIAGITGCGEETADPITATKTEDALFGSLSEMKVPAEMAPGAPSATTDGTPFVKSVHYYSDWKLTEEIDSEERVPVGTTIFAHIVFSEPMKHRLTDNPEKKGALPVLQYWVNSEVTRFRVMQHGASGENFVSGDAKPKGGSTDDFVCKYKVGEEDKGSQFWIRVGEWSMDLEWDKLKESYIHQTKLKLGKVPETTQEQPGQPEEPVVVVDDTKKPEPTTVEPADSIPPTVVSITHYRDSDGTTILEGESVEHNTTVNTEIVFSEPINPESIVVTYTTGGKEAKRYAYSTGGVHWRGLFQVGKDNKSLLCKQDAREDAFVVTLEKVEDLAGNTLAEPVTMPELTVTPRPVATTPVPQEPTQPPAQTPIDNPDTPPTTPQEPVTDPEDPLKRAIAVARRIYDRVQEIAALFYAGSITLNEYHRHRDQILVEETGLQYYNRHFIGDLALIYNEEYPQDTGRILLGNFSRRGITVEWMRLYFAHQSKTKNELLVLFRQSCKDGKVSIEYNQFW